MNGLSLIKPESRCGHVAAPIGKYMILWGGYSVFEQYDGIHQEPYYVEKYHNGDEVWIYDTEFSQWIKRSTLGDNPPGTSGGAVSVVNGLLYLFGGFNQGRNTNKLYTLDIKTNIWTLLLKDVPMSQLPSPRDKLTMWSYQNKLYVFGGFGPPVYRYLFEHGLFELDPDTQILSFARGWNSQVLVYDTVSEKWTNPECSGNLPTPRAAMSSARIGHEVYIFGGRFMSHRLNELYKLDLNSFIFSKISLDAGGPEGRTWHTFTPLNDEEIFLYGGFTQNETPLSDAWIYNVKELKWKQIPMPTEESRLWHTACLCDTEDIVIFGGCCNNILRVNETMQLTTDFLQIRLKPKSLYRISMDCTFANRNRLMDSWNTLPQTISETLYKRLEGLEQSKKQSDPVNINHGDYVDDDDEDFDDLFLPIDNGIMEFENFSDSDAGSDDGVGYGFEDDPNI